MTDGAFRCSLASRERGELLEGTASTVSAFVLVEDPGPWGTDATRDSRLPGDVKDHLRVLERHYRVRPLLIRRPGRVASGRVRVFAAYARGPRPWVETVLLDEVTGLLDLPLEPLAEGRSPGLTAYDEPLFLVCTHGRHDACCAERGRPLAAALAETDAEHTWEVSHIGGDRFAGNVLVLPHGLYYGRVEPDDAPGFVAAHHAGELDLNHLRGRSTLPVSVQAAEVHLRRHLGEARLAPLVLESRVRAGSDTVTVFDVAGERWEVRIRTEVRDAAPLTCRAAAPGTSPAHRLVGLRPLD
jgi:hypothetical protein